MKAIITILSLIFCAEAFAIPADVETYFTKETNTASKAIELNNSAQTEIYLMMFSLTDKDIVRSLVDAKKRGVDVKIIVDNRQSKSVAMTTALNILKSASISIKVSPANGAYFHVKSAEIDGLISTTGSYNATKHALNSNWERYDIVKSPEIAKHTKDYFMRWWNDKRFISY